MTAPKSRHPFVPDPRWRKQCAICGRTRVQHDPRAGTRDAAADAAFEDAVTRGSI